MATTNKTQMKKKATAKIKQAIKKRGADSVTTHVR